MLDLSRTPGGAICTNCGQVRPLASLIAFWPADTPAERRYVCRPLDPIPPFMSCFRDVVGTVLEHTIMPADQVGAAA